MLCDVSYIELFTRKILMFVVEWFFYPDGIIPDSDLTGLNNTYIIYIYIYKVDWAIGLISRVFANGLIPVWVIQRLKKWFLMPPCLTLCIIRCSSYWKGSLWVTLNYGRHLYLLFSYIKLVISFFCYNRFLSIAREWDRG